MNDRLAIRFLERLTTRETTGLKTFVTNPYFNNNRREEVTRLHEYIIRFAPAYNASDFTDENAFNTVYPDRDFDVRVLNRLMSLLLIVIKKYIGCIYGTSSVTNTEFDMLRFCAKRFSERFDNQLRRIVRIAEDELKGGDLYHYMLKIEELYADHLAISRRDNFMDFAQRIDQYFAVSKLPLLCEMLNRQNLDKATYDFSNLDTYLSFFEDVGSRQTPLVQLWHCAVSILKNILHESSIEPADYLEFKDLINQNRDRLTEGELRNLFVYLGNALNYLFDDDIYYRETFELHQKRFEEEKVFVKGYLTPQTVKNTVNAAIQTNNIEWAEHFIERYSPRFAPEYAQQTEIYCRALISFYNGWFDVALQQIEGFEHQDIFFRLGKRVMLIQIYFELANDGNDDDLEDLFYDNIKRFRDFIGSLNRSDRNKRINSDWKKSYEDFRKFTKQIFGTAGVTKEDIDNIESNIQKIPARKLPEKQWLLQKLDELK